MVGTTTLNKLEIHFATSKAIREGKTYGTIWEEIEYRPEVYTTYISQHR